MARKDNKLGQFARAAGGHLAGALFPQVKAAVDVGRTDFGDPSIGLGGAKELGGALFPQAKFAAQVAGRVPSTSARGLTRPETRETIAKKRKAGAPEATDQLGGAGPAPVEGDLFPRGISEEGQVGGTDVFRYTPQNAQEREEFGSAIFSDTAGGATPGGFNEAIQQGGQGVFGIGETPKRTDAFGNSLDIADSMNRAAETMRQSRIGAQPQPQRRQQALPSIGQPQVNQFQQAAMDIMKNLPSGKPGDYRKRQSMLKQAEILSGMGQQQIGAIGDQRTAQVGMAGVAQREEEAGMRFGSEQQQLAQKQQLADRKFAMEQFGLMNPPAKEEQLIRPYKTGEGLEGPTYSQPQAWTPGGNLRSIGQQTTGQQPDLTTLDGLKRAVDNGQIDKAAAEKVYNQLQSK